ncbi:MAG: diguanylate cyclase [Gammaproteobacteria bacterium]|nr:MAG: diguanylate cyclase [Gammaproteobacteria bacterium]
MADTITLSELSGQAAAPDPGYPAAPTGDPEAELLSGQSAALLPAWVVILALAALALDALLAPHIPGWRLMPWSGLLALDGALLLLLHHWQRRGLPRVIRHWPTLFAGVHWLTALGWGLGGLLLLPEAPAHVAMAWLGTVLGLNAIAITVTAPLFTAWLLGTLIALAPLAVWARSTELTTGGPLPLACGALLLLSLTLFAWRHHSRQRDLIRELVSTERMRDLLTERQELQQTELRRLRLSRREAQHARKELQARLERLETIFQSVDEALLLLDPRGRILDANGTACVMSGLSLEQLLQRPLQQAFRLQDEGQGLPLPDPVAICLKEKGSVDGPEDAILKLDGERTLPVEYHLTPRIGQDGEVLDMVMVLRDVTERRRQARRLSWHATHDPLTGLINRREFERRLGKLVRHAELHGTVHALCYLDLDHFKEVNDRSGHEAGDELLRGLTRALQGRIRATDTFARLGGDEFGILFYNCTPEKALQLAQGLRRTVEEYDFRWQGVEHRTGASIGLTLIDQRRRPMAELMREADRACYLAKHAGRNRVHLFQAGDEATTGTVQEETAQDGALQLRRFSPLHPGDRGAVCEVVPAGGAGTRAGQPADESDRRLFRSALAALGSGAGSLREGDYVAIPLRAESICDPAFLRFVTDTLDQSGVDPGQICFELDHARLINHMARARSFIIALKARGCRFILDGYRPHPDGIESLDLLPVDFLKLAPMAEGQGMDPEEHYRLIRELSRQGHCRGILTISGEQGDDRLRDALRRMGIDYGLEPEAASG